jgi:hypothetical protein
MLQVQELQLHVLEADVQAELTVTLTMLITVALVVQLFQVEHKAIYV